MMIYKPAALLARMSERELQAAIIQAATLCGWRCYHTYDSRRSAPGFPDLVLLRWGELLFVELKTEKGKLRPDQAIWLDLLRSAGQEVYLWRPADLDVAFQRLQQDERRPPGQPRSDTHLPCIR